MRRIPFLLSLALAASVVALPLLARTADARGRSTDTRLVVSLDAGVGPRAPRTLVRFPRNDVALVQTAAGHLTLKVGRTHLLGAGRPVRRMRVRVTLDVTARRITAKVGARRLRVRRRLVRERCARVAPGARRVAVTPASAVCRVANEDPPKGGSTPEAGTTTPGTGNGAAARPIAATPPIPVTPSPAPAPVGRLFAADSVWNAPLAADAPLDPAGAALVGKLRDTVAENLASGKGPWISTNEGSTPLYRVPANQPLVRVQLHTGWWGDALQKTFEAVPIPSDARPASGPDGHMAVWQPSTDRFWEFFHARKSADGWHADFGGAMVHASRSPGYYDRTSWPGLSETYWGASASSLPVAAGVMRIDELKAGQINHALSVAIPFARPKAFSWPAQRTDGSSRDLNAIPEGARFRLDPRLDLEKLGLPRMTRMMAEAVQRHGMIVVDQTGWAVGFGAEDPTPTGADPYYGQGGLFGGLWPSELLARFPWEHLQLLKMDLRSS